MALLTMFAATGLKILFFLGFTRAQTTAPASILIEPPADAPAEIVSEPPADPLAEFLDQLEHATDDLRDINADVRKITVDVLGRATERTGSLIYQIKPETEQKRFAITFDKVKVGNRFRRKTERFIFDGRWLAEIDEPRKVFIKREVVPPGETLDPLKLGEGPFPLPIGQKRADVLERFDVAFVEQPAEGDLAALENVRGIRLTPKPGSREAREFTHVDVFYDLATMLPVGVVAPDPNGEESDTVILSNLKRNEGVDEALLDIDEPQGEGWRIEIKPFAPQ